MSDDEYWKARNQGQNGNARPVGGGPGAWQGYDQGKRERENQQQNSYTPPAPPSYNHTQNNNTFNNPTNIQNDNTGGFSPSYSSSGGGEGCITAFFPVISYIIVFSTLFNFIIGAINTLSITYTYKIPEWLPSIAILTFTCIVLYYRKYIGWMAVISIVMLIVNSFMFSDQNKTNIPQKLSVQTQKTLPRAQIIQELKERLKDDVKLVHTPPSKLSMNCRPCALILGKNSKASPEVKIAQSKICEKYRLECNKSKKSRYMW
jgi:hypothetical protein